MEKIVFELDLLEEARDFLKSLPKDIRGKIGFNKDANLLVVATHGIIKKTQKTPKNEIAKAESLRKKYFDNKSKEI